MAETGPPAASPADPEPGDAVIHPEPTAQPAGPGATSGPEAVPGGSPTVAPALDTARVDDALLRRLATRIPLTGERPSVPVLAPFTGAVLGEVPECRPEDVLEAVRRARAAHAAWAATGLRQRRRILLRFHDLLLDRREQAMDLVQLETGKARRDALEELVDVALVARHLALRSAGVLRPRRRRGTFPAVTITHEVRVPRGVVGVISPWNYPLTLVISDALAAIAAGNAVVAKPDPAVPFTPLLAAEVLYEAGVPPDVLLVVPGDGPTLGPALIDATDFLTFTGSTATGRLVARRAAERLKPALLELGGKNPLIVLEDADPDAAAAGAARACFANAGQLCVATERVLVASSIHDDFVPRFVAATRALRLGARLDHGADVGSLISARQLEAVDAHVRDAVERGARVLAGGRRRPDVGPYFYEPTILADVPPDATVRREETFGPVAGIYRFDTPAEAVDIANEGAYGLSASIWTRRPAAAGRLAAEIRAGMININEGYRAAWGSVDAPIGGMRDSGVGRRRGREGILAYTEAQTVSRQRWFSLTPSPRVGAHRFADLIIAAVRLLRWLPGFR